MGNWEDYLPVKIHKVAFGMARRAEKALAAACDLSLPQFLLMASVENKKQCKQNEVAHSRFLSEAAVSKLVDGLTAKRMIERLGNPESRREKILRLTPAGEEVFQKAEKIVKDSVGGVLGNLSGEEQLKLEQILDKVIRFTYTDETNYA